jgi:hypothetical protein
MTYGVNDFFGLLLIGWLIVYLLHQTIGGLLGIFWRSLHERNAIKIAFPGKKP